MIWWWRLACLVLAGVSFLGFNAALGNWESDRGKLAALITGILVLVFCTLIFVPDEKDR